MNKYFCYHVKNLQKTIGILILIAFIFHINVSIATAQKGKKKPKKSTSFKQSKSKEDLEDQRAKLLNEINLNKEILEKTQKEKEASLTQVKSLNNQLVTRENIINNYQSEINVLDNHIYQNNRTLKSLNTYMGDLKEEYGTILRNTYRTNSSYNKLLFLFSASSFNDAFKRFLYLRQYGQYRKRQADLIANTTYTIEEEMGILHENKEIKNVVLEEQSKEKDVLEEQKKEKDAKVALLLQKEGKLRADIKAKNRQAAELKKTIEATIRREIELARKRAEEAARKEAEAARKAERAAGTTASSESRKPTTSSPTPTMTPEAMALSTSFSNNQGALPWPVEKGVITEYFGSHPHPVLTGVTVNNNGVDISSNPGAGVRCIFEGTVSSVVSNPSFQNAIIIKHGEYFSVYSNVVNVTVRAGDKVSTKERIGTVYTDNEGNTEVHLEIWKGTSKLNPSSWIAR